MSASCSALDRGFFVARQSISLSSTYISQSALTCIKSETVLHPHSLLLTGTVSVLSISPVNQQGLLPNHSPVRVLSPLHRHNSGSARETDLSQSQNSLPTSELFQPTGSEPVLPYPSKREVLAPGYVPTSELFSVMIFSAVKQALKKTRVTSFFWVVGSHKKGEVQLDLALLLTGQAHLPFTYTWHQKNYFWIWAPISSYPKLQRALTLCEGHPAGSEIRPPLWPPFADGAIFYVSLSLSWLGHTPKCYCALTSLLDREDIKNVCSLGIMTAPYFPLGQDRALRRSWFPYLFPCWQTNPRWISQHRAQERGLSILRNDGSCRPQVQPGCGIGGCVC